MILGQIYINSIPFDVSTADCYQLGIPREPEICLYGSIFRVAIFIFSSLKNSYICFLYYLFLNVDFYTFLPVTFVSVVPDCGVPPRILFGKMSDYTNKQTNKYMPMPTKQYQNTNR